MNLGNPWRLDDPFQAALDRFLKILKGREEQCSRVLQPLNKAASCHSEIENSIFVHDEIHKYRQLTQEVAVRDSDYQAEAVELEVRCGGCDEDAQAIRLLRRVTFRALEILQNGVSQLNPKHPALIREGSALKTGCLRIINNENSNQKVVHVIKYISKYQTQKRELYVCLLKDVSDALENGDARQMERLKKKFSTVVPLSQESNSESRSEVAGRTRGLKVRQKSAVNKAKEDYIEAEQKRAQHARRIRKYMDNLKDAMQINRQDFMDNHGGWYNLQHNKEHLIRELLQKNKVNDRMISEFQTKKRKMHHKLKNSQLRGSQLEDFAINKSEIVELKQNKSEMQSQKKCMTTRKSLLFQVKEGENREKKRPSQLLSKQAHKEHLKSRLRASSKKRDQERQQELEEKQNILRALEEVITQNEEITLKTRVDNIVSSGQQKLPLLNKRAYSVDRNYAKIQETIQTKTLDSSTRVSQQLKKRLSGDKTGQPRFQKAQIFPSKIEIELKGSRGPANFNNRLLGISDYYRHLCF